MKRTSILCLVAALFASVAHAEEAQMYFSAKIAPAGSLSVEGAGTPAIYLRWDGLNTDLPTSIVEFRLTRNGTELALLDGKNPMSPAEIELLYDGSAQSRRRAETIRWLNEQTLLDTTDAFDYVDGTNFGAAIQARLMIDPFWAVFASRVDFNIARARHRAYLDTDAGPGVHEYELFAISDSGQSVRVGRTTVDTAAFSPVPAAQAFMQIDDYARCDAPEVFKEHGSVMLTWLPAANGPADRFIESVNVAGYDLYRTVDNVSNVAALDLRTLASAVPHDIGGEFVIPGLEKVNDQPLLYSGPAAEESINAGWNSPYAQYIQNAPDAAAEGLHPGDTRAYYLVARDFTGNYGETTGALVTVPDMVPPPAPWTVRTERNEATNSFRLVWDHIDVANYFRDYQYARTYCNLDTARPDKRLTWVGEGETCDTAAQVPVELDVVSYIVYRFDLESHAGNFSDRDGDGFADASERMVNVDDLRLSTPGTACTPADPKGGFWIADIPASSAMVRPSGRQVIEFADATPALDRGQVYWYRIAAVGSNGSISPLSAPIRGFFPARDRPERPDFTSQDNIVRLGTEDCTYDVTVEPFQDGGAFELLPFAWDTTDDAAFVRVWCDTNAGETLESWLQMPNNNDTFVLGFGFVPAVNINTNICLNLGACPTGARNVEYYSGAGTLLGSAVVTFPDNFDVCDSITDRSYLTKDCELTSTELVLPGEVTDDPLVLDYPLDPGECLNIYRDIGGTEAHLRTECDPAAFPLSIETLGMPGGRVCLSVAVQNTSNEVSSKTRLPCVVIEGDLLPSPPQPLEIAFDDGADTGTISLLPPQDPVTGSIVEWYWKGAISSAQSRFTAFLPHAGQTSSDGPQALDIELTALQSGSDWQEEWCFRARSVGPASTDEGGFGGLSAWSAERCGLREPVTGPPPTYLPWPAIGATAGFGNVPSRFLPGDLTPIIQIGENVEFSNNICDPIVATCPQEGGAACLNLAQALPSAAAGTCPEFCAVVNAAVADDLGFVVYRQRTSDTSDPSQFGDFIQNSPLIDRINCVSAFDGSGGEINGGAGVLADPFLFMADFNNLEPGWDGLHVFYADRQPFTTGDFYRYHLVYMNGDGEIIGQSQTSWLEATGQ